MADFCWQLTLAKCRKSFCQCPPLSGWTTHGFHCGHIMIKSTGRRQKAAREYPWTAGAQMLPYSASAPRFALPSVGQRVAILGVEIVAGLSGHDFTLGRSFRQNAGKHFVSVHEFCVDSIMNCLIRTAHAYSGGLDISCLPFPNPLGQRLAFPHRLRLPGLRDISLSFSCVPQQRRKQRQVVNQCQSLGLRYAWLLQRPSRNKDLS